MGTYLGRASAEQLDNGQWRFLADLAYRMGPSGEVTIITPAGFTTDWASIPWLARLLLSPTDPHYLRAAGTHDFLYARGGIARVVADAIFLDAMRALGCPFWKRVLLYLGVRLGGWWVWRKYRRAEKAAPAKVVTATIAAPDLSVPIADQPPVVPPTEI